MKKRGSVISIVALLVGLGGGAVAEQAVTPKSPLVFTPLALVNGWVGGPFSTSKPAVAEAFGIVHFKGAISSGTTGLAFTLPVGFRPAKIAYVPVDLCNANKGRLIISPTGATSVQALTTFSQAQCFTSLDGASFAE